MFSVKVVLLFRCVAVLMSTALPMLLASAQRQHPARNSTTFIAPDGAFHFSYPSHFQTCTKGNMHLCTQSIAPCEHDALVCVVYTGREVGDTDLEGASFQVREIGQHMTADECTTPQLLPVLTWPEFGVPPENPSEIIGDVRFVHGVTVRGRSINTDLYRTFRDRQCFELSVSQSGATPGLHQVMSDILYSFRFAH